jgi:SAM-dependent methyltransferase
MIIDRSNAMKSAQEIREVVADRYAKIAVTGSSCCGDASQSVALGYSSSDLEQVPESADMSLGCGAPVGYAELAAGERVLDLGSGGGLDAFLAARVVGDTGHVIGVDMTPQMIELARANAAAVSANNVEFRQGLIEQIPAADASIDVLLSNCVINLSPDKDAVFAEAFRVLAPGGRLIVSDMVTSDEVARSIDPEGWAACIDGAIPEASYVGGLQRAGFVDIDVLERTTGDDVYSVTLRAVKAAD